MAVYTVITDAMIDRLLMQYDIGQRQSLTGITQGVENTNYKLETDQGHYILTIYEKRVDPADLPFFISLKSHLASKGYPCPTPIMANNGHVLQQFQGKSMAIVSFLNGSSTSAPEWEHCQAAGTILAKMHRNGTDFDMHRKNALGQKAWRPLMDQIKVDISETDHADHIPQIENWLTSIEQNWPNHLPQGIIHGDLFPDNVLFDNTIITGVIDFYFACQDMLAYDLAVMINAWCFDKPHLFNLDKARALIAGYTECRPLQDNERQAMLILARGAAMRFYLTRLYDWIHTPKHAQVKPHNPDDYWQRLLFLHRIETPSELGISYG
jgi:homoserine kinase type II